MSPTLAPNHRSAAPLHVAGAVTVASLVVLLAVAACAPSSGGNDNQAEPGAPGSGVVTSGPLPSSSPGTPTSNVVSPEPAVGLHRERWTRVEPVRGTSEVL